MAHWSLPLHSTPFYAYHSPAFERLAALGSWYLIGRSFQSVEKMANMQGRSGAQGVKGMMSDEAILAIKERMTAKKKGAGWRPLPRRGNVKKQIVKDVIDVVKGRLRTSKNSRIAPEKVGSVSFEENGQAC